MIPRDTSRYLKAKVSHHIYLSLSKLPPNCDTSPPNTQIILEDFHISYIFKVNQLTRCVLDAVCKKILPTFLRAFLMLLSNFKNYIT